METIKVNVQEVDGQILDWLVAKALGKRVGTCMGKPCYFEETWESSNEDFRVPQYSTDPTESYPIIEKEGIQSNVFRNEKLEVIGWQCYIESGYLPIGDGPTVLIAAMRCFVAGKLGYEVEIPKEMQCLIKA
jgi:hypothetical protein